MALTRTATAARPRWPGAPFDPARAYAHYGVAADELVVYFGEQPVPSFVDAIDAPDVDGLGLLVEENGDVTCAEEVVGVHVYPLLFSAVQGRPEWARLAWALLAGDLGEQERPALLAAFVAEVRELFDRHWTPAPPIAEQLAALTVRKR